MDTATLTDLEMLEDLMYARGHQVMDADEGRLELLINGRICLIRLVDDKKVDIHLFGRGEDEMLKVLGPTALYKSVGSFIISSDGLMARFAIFPQELAKMDVDEICSLIKQMEDMMDRIDTITGEFSTKFVEVKSEAMKKFVELK